MKKPRNQGKEKKEMLEEYNFSNGVRGKHAAKYAEGRNSLPKGEQQWPYNTKR